ncbi:hypothetical protein AGMMS49944_23200 [Spirochaetia bacterium]|nr:hypothetical protein AGMMS49944_23200 [Spirochaetia bacterium]
MKGMRCVLFLLGVVTGVYGEGNVLSGNYGSDIRKDIASRQEWIARLTECEQYYANYMRTPPLFYLVYTTDLKSGKVDYTNETIPYSFTVSLFPVESWFKTITKAVNKELGGLIFTGRAAAWGLDYWPQKNAAAGPSPFTGRKGSITIAVELVNENGLTIGRQNSTLAYEWSVSFQGGPMQITPKVDTSKTVTFPAVKADLITDRLSVKFTGIGEGITVLTDADYKRLLTEERQRTEAAELQRMADNFVRVPGGTFTMGSPMSEDGRGRNETQHQVTVSSFFMGTYEVTNEEYHMVMGTNPRSLKGNNYPVSEVGWDDAVKFCNALSKMAGLTPAYTITGDTVTWNRNAQADPRSAGYRLPTEAEWEYACRAGTTGPFSMGDTITVREANYKIGYANDYWYWYIRRGQSGDGQPVAVGSFAPNPWGLYDMQGNVREWCWDLYGDYNAGSQTDPQGPVTPTSWGPYHVNRGGSHNEPAEYQRSAYRGQPSTRSSSSLGFRICRSGYE